MTSSQETLASRQRTTSSSAGTTTSSEATMAARCRTTATGQVTEPRCERPRFDIQQEAVPAETASIKKKCKPTKTFSELLRFLYRSMLKSDQRSR